VFFIFIETTRTVYDKNGEHGLKNKVPDANGKVTGGGYIYRGNAEEIFNKVFGSTNPFTDQDHSECIYKVIREANVPQEGNEALPMAPEDINIIFECTLWEFYNGAIKTGEYSRDILDKDGRTMTSVMEHLKINLEPGMT
jgi:DnaJ-class molecular chaperone